MQLKEIEKLAASVMEKAVDAKEVAAWENKRGNKKEK